MAFRATLGALALASFALKSGLMLSLAAAAAIREHSRQMSSVPIIEARDYRSAEALRMEPDRARHDKARSHAERVNSDLKDNHGGRSVRLSSGAKVMTHLMFGVLVMSAKAQLRLYGETVCKGVLHL